MPNGSLNYRQWKDEDCRLRILMILNEQSDDALSSTLIRKSLFAMGHNTSPDYVLAQLDALADVGGVKLTPSADPEIVIAVLTQAGIDHLERRTPLRGVAAVVQRR